MLNSHEINIENIIVHQIGSKTEEQGVKISQSSLRVEDDEMRDLFMYYFLNSFKPGEYYHLAHEKDVNLNEVHAMVSAIFDDPACLHEQSVNLANHLYEQSTHPKIKPGELYVVYFTNCLMDGEITDAVGLFKSESKETFLKVLSAHERLEVRHEEGVNVNKLDKGCLIFNLERDKGFLLAIVDNLNKKEEAQYWRDNFLNIKARKDEYQQTKGYLDLCKTFVLEQVPKEFDVSRADQADFLNKSANYFKKNDEFSFNEFAGEVMKEPEVIESFKGYKKQYEAEQNVELNDEFAISSPAVKKQGKDFKSVIKLDKNFHVYVHGGRECIVKGFDEKTGMHYYQLYFKEEE